MAENVVEQIPLEKLLSLLSDEDVVVRYNTSELIRNLVTNSSENARMFASASSEKNLMAFLKDAPEDAKESGIQSLIILTNSNHVIANNIVQLGIEGIIMDILRNSLNLNLKNQAFNLLGSIGQFADDSYKNNLINNAFKFTVLQLKNRGQNGIQEDIILQHISSILKTFKDVKGLQNLLTNEGLSLPL